jgi:SulP family sulfate permease
VIGVGLSLAIYLLDAASDVSVVELVERGDGQIEEREPARNLRSNRVTVLDVYGQLFFAAARTLKRHLPRAEAARNAAVIVRLRGRTHVGATLVQVLSDYADSLEAGGGRLYLSGLGEPVRDELARSGKLRLDGPVRAVLATPIVGESTRRAVEQATAWLVEGTAPGGGGSRPERIPAEPAGGPAQERC